MSQYVVAVPFGIDPDTYKPGHQAAARRRLGLPRDASVALHLGRLTPIDKADWDTLLWLARQVSSCVPDFRLVIAGADRRGFASRLEAWVRHDGLSDHVAVFANVPDELIPCLYHASDVMLLVGDSAQETQGLAILEAMSSGVPVVAPDWDGYRDMVTSDVGALVDTYMYEGNVPFEIDGRLGDGGGLNVGLRLCASMDRGAAKEALIRLLRLPDVLKECGRCARKRVVAHFSEAQMVKRYLQVWRDAVTDRKAVRGLPPARSFWPDLTSCFAKAYASSQITDDSALALSGTILGEPMVPRGLEKLFDPELCADIVTALQRPRALGAIVEALSSPGRGRAYIRRHVLAMLKCGVVVPRRDIR
jgi:hypothetical protein